jgi:hypothetical protein
MNRSRRLMISATAVVGVGVLFAMSSRFTGTARAAVGPVPAEALALPANSAMVMGFDVRAVTSSEFYAKFGQEGAPGHVRALEEIEKKTGLNPARDIDAVVIAVQPEAKAAADGRRKDESGLVFVTGRFDVNRLIQLRPEGSKVVPERRGDVTIFADPGRGGVVAVLDAGILVAGSAVAVDAFLSNRASGRGIEDNKAMVDLLKRVEPGSTWWAVGDGTVLKQFTANAGADAPQLPAVKSVVAYGHLDPEVGLTATAEASDTQSATKIADVLRGFSAMLSLQAGQRKELAAIADGISVATEEDKVHVKATITHELIESLQKSAAAARTAKKADDSVL